MKKISLFVIGLAMLTFYGCSRGPTDEVVKKLSSDYVSENLKNRKNHQIKSIEIVQKGKFNKQDKYYPFKVKVQGTYQMLEGWDYKLRKQIVKTKKYDETINFAIYKDDYDEWKILTESDAQFLRSFGK